MSDRLDVWLDGRLAGGLIRDPDGALRFSYDASYVAEASVAPLSASMPKDRLEHQGPHVGRWFDNLLPDDDEVRRRWARQEGATASVFGLLGAMGIDCAGAVQVVAPGVVPSQQGTLEPVDHGAIARRLRALRQDVSAWTDADDKAGRWSLGGAQGKFALAQLPDGSWAAPAGRAPSTHIFKVGIARFADADLAEFVTMRTAAHLGLQVTKARIDMFEDQSALIVERYDRILTPSGAVRRLHQEDMCQALGISRHEKYQSDGGPGIPEIVAHLKKLHPADAAVSRERFARAIAFNWLTASPDAHAKNYSLIVLGNRSRLAPLYDLTSGALLYDPKRMFHKGASAMKIGRDYKFRRITNSNLERCAHDLGVSPDWFHSVIDGYRAALPDALADATDEATAHLSSAEAARLKDRYTANLADALALNNVPTGTSPRRSDPIQFQTRGKSTPASTRGSFVARARAVADVELDAPLGEGRDPFEV